MGATTLNVNLTELVRKLTGTGEIATVHEERFAPNPGSAVTGGLRRISGTTRQGQPWSVFVKSINSARHWPMIEMVPEFMRADFIANLPWRAEVDAYRANLDLPEGLRMPHLYAIDDLGDDRIDIWMEDVRGDSTEWDLPRYDRAAYLLGGLASRNPAPPPEVGNLRGYVEGRIMHDCLPKLQDPALWQHPLVAEHADPRLRADLAKLGERITELLDGADRLPHSMVHGDSSPHNLMVAANGEIVAIDWGWYCSQPIGFDLGQLLVGLAHDGLTQPEELPAIHATIESAYLRALGQREGPIYEAITGYRCTVVLRSAFTAIPLERLDEPTTPELTELFRCRTALARFLVNLGLAL